MHVVATAGHVDHGKSTLVRRLTGMEPDRWAEERRRGMTIDLGFAWTDLPSGQTLAFVDVPGHERFVPNMLAGVGPAPAVLLVVAADEGWMPQSQEHLEALDALGVRHGLLVITRSDLMDPELALDEAREQLRGTSLDGLASVCVSAPTGEGIEELRAALGTVADALPEPDTSADVRLWIDRVFTIRGAGTVVTGTLTAGTLQVGQQLELASTGETVTVRELQALGQQRERVVPVARVAVNLRGVAHERLRRGDALLAAGRWRGTTTVDVRLTTAGSAGRAVLHLGAAAVPVHVRPLGADTARLTLAHPLALRIGDRGALRYPGTERAITGATVLDTMPAALVRRGAGAARAVQLAALDGTPDGAAELTRRGVVRRSELLAMGAAVPADAVGRGEWLLDPSSVPGLARTLADAVRVHAREHALDPGMPVEAARRIVGLPDARLLELLQADPAMTGISTSEGRLHHGAQTLPATVQVAVDELCRQLDTAPFAAPDASRLAELGLGPTQLAAASRLGQLLKIGDGLYLLPGALDVAVGRLRTLPTPFTLSEARQALETTRRVAVPLLERLGADGRTRRHADGTHEVVAVSTAAPSRSSFPEQRT